MQINIMYSMRLDAPTDQPAVKYYTLVCFLRTIFFHCTFIWFRFISFHSVSSALNYTEMKAIRFKCNRLCLVLSHFIYSFYGAIHSFIRTFIDVSTSTHSIPKNSRLWIHNTAQKWQNKNRNLINIVISPSNSFSQKGWRIQGLITIRFYKSLHSDTACLGKYLAMNSNKKFTT